MDIELENEYIIQEIKILKENCKNGKDWWNDLTDEQKKSIERGLNDIEEGREVPYEQVREKYKKWLTK